MLLQKTDKNTLSGIPASAIFLLPEQNSIRSVSFQVGDKVKLIYDCAEFVCPEMCVKKVTPEWVTCVWEEDDTLIHATEYPPYLLVLIS